MLPVKITLICLVAVNCVIAQVPTYLNPKYVYTGLPSSSVSSATVQSLLARHLAQAALNSPKRSLATYATPTSSPSRYAAMAAASNPSIVAIPLYVRNQAQKPALYDLLSSTALGGEKKSQVAALSPKYLSYINKKPAASTNIESAIPYRGETVARYEKPASFASYATAAKYETPKASSSSYEPVRSYELKSSEPGYGDASSVSLLSSSYSYAPAASKPQSQYAGVAQNPRLKAVEYDDNQKSALADFASALENFDLKAISNQDIYDLPAINPPLTRIPTKPKQESRPVAAAEESYAPAPSRQQSPSSYGSSSSSYGSSASASPSSYDDSRSYASSAPSAASYSPSSYADSSAQADSYRSVADSYRSSPANAYRASSSAYSDERNSAPADSYRAASSSSDSYGSSASYVPAPASYAESTSYSASSGDIYSSRPSSAASSYSPDYYTDSSAPRPNPDDPNCPYKLAASSSSNSGSTAEYAPAPSSASVSSSSSSVAKLSSSSSAPIKETSGYEADELDPSKLDLKIVHLPVSVLKRLVGSGELALPSFNKKK